MSLLEVAQISILHPRHAALLLLLLPLLLPKEKLLSRLLFSEGLLLLPLQMQVPTLPDRLPLPPMQVHHVLSLHLLP